MGKILRLNPLLIAAFFIFPIICCNKASDGEPPPPAELLTIIADAEGDGVIISWNDVSDVDGYLIITPDGDTIALDYDETSNNDNTPLSTGEYIIYAVQGFAKGDTSIISSAPFSYPANVTLYVWPHERCVFRFDTTGGVGINPPPDPSEADFYLNDITMPFEFTSADEPPYSGDRTTHIRNMGVVNFFEAPTSGYYSSEEVLTGDYYTFRVIGDYYAKVYVISTTDSTATFRYWFQTIQSLRLF